MRDSFRTLLLFSLSFIGASTSTGNATMETKIPVVFLGDLEMDNTPSAVVEWMEEQSAVDQLQAMIQAAPPPSIRDLSESAKDRTPTLDAVIQATNVYADWSPEQWTKALPGSKLDDMADGIAPVLGDETIPIAERNLIARILMCIGDRRGFDWNLERIKRADPTDPSAASGNLWLLHLAGFQHREWLDGVELWPLIEPQLNPEHSNERIGKDLCPGEMQQWYIRQLRRDDLPDDTRFSYLFELSWYAPSLAALEACSGMFEKPGPDYPWSTGPRYAETLTRFGQGGDMHGASHPDTILGELD